MSVLHTESFVAFQQFTGADAPWGTSKAATNNAFKAAFKRAGYYCDIAAQDDYTRSGSLVVRPDPVYPDRSALVYSSSNTLNNNNGAAYNFGAAIRKPLPTQGEAIICGFSLYVPPEYVPRAIASAQAMTTQISGPEPRGCSPAEMRVRVMTPMVF